MDGAVEIRPFDQTARFSGDGSCTLLLKQFPHTVLVTFPEAGPAIVRAVGQKVYGDMPQTRELNIVVR